MSEKYPLHQLELIKKKRLEEAERVLREKREKLLNEQEQLKKAQAAHDKVFNHRVDKLTKLREALDTGLRADKIEQMGLYLKTVEEKLKIEEKKLEAQKGQVKRAEEEVEKARKEMFKKQKEIEKLKEHRTIWTKEMLQELEKEEAKEADETGEAGFLIKKKRREGR